MKYALGIALTALPAAMAAKPTVAPPPIVTVQEPPDEKYGDWTVAFLANGTTIASAGNSGGATIGTVCSKTGCTAFFNPKVKCESGSKYPGLVNAPSAAFSVIFECEKIDDVHLLAFPLDGEMTDAMSIGGQIGIAFPMQSGQFEVSRFSLTGAARATARAHQYSTGSSGAKQQASDNYAL